MQTFKTKSVLSQLALGLGLFAAAGTALAAYPERAVTVVVGYGAGGGADTIARLYAERLAAEFKQSFIVDNKPGAGATLAAAAVAKANPDGYTLMMAPTAVFTITPNVRKTNYDPLKDYTAVSTLAAGLDVVVASKKLPAANLGEFIALAKKEPGKYSFASSGLATTTHLMGEVFSEAAGIKMLHVPYKSSSEYLPDLIEGRVHLAFDPVLLSQVSGGTLNFIGLVADERSPQHPDVGTIKEAGVDMAVAYNKLWYGLVGPANMPADVVERLSAAIEKISQEPEVAEKLAVTGMTPLVIKGEDFAKTIATDSSYYKGLIEKFDLKLEE